LGSPKHEYRELDEFVDDKKLKVEVKGQGVVPNLEEHDNQTVFMTTTTTTFRGGIQSS
jgi:hypothetical protein